MIDPTVDFPYFVADYLVECRDAGLTFDEAWTDDLDEAAKAAGFGWQQHPFTVETSLSFAKRHLRAAYELRDTPRYCIEDCSYLALEGEHCLFHTVTKGKAA